MGVSNGGAQVPQKLARIESFLKVAGLVEWATKALTRAKGSREALNAADREFMESTHGSSGGYGEGPNLKPGIVEKGLGMAVKADEAFKAPFNKADELVGKKLSDVKGKRTAANEAALKQQATAEEFAGAESGYGAPAAELKGKGLGEKALTGAKKVTEVAKNSPYLTTAGVLGAGTGTAAALGALSDKDEEETTTGGDATPMAPGMLDSLAQWWQEKGELPGNLTPSQAAAALVALGVTAGGVGYGIHKAVKGKKKKSGEGHEADSSERKSED